MAKQSYFVIAITLATLALIAAPQNPDPSNQPAQAAPAPPAVQASPDEQQKQPQPESQPQAQPAAAPATSTEQKPANTTDENASTGERKRSAPAFMPPPVRVDLPPPPPGKDDFVLTSETELVLLDASVKDANGGFASGLTKDNFKIFEDGKEQAPTVFSAQDVPVTVGMVVDNSGSVRPKRPEIVTAALTFAQQSHPQDEIFVVNFNDSVKLGLPDGILFTDKIDVLRTALLSNPVQGRTSLYDGLKTAFEHLQKGRRDKKTLILISDGGDNASETTQSEILQLAQATPVTVYTVGIFNPEDKDKNPGFLKHLAAITGGEAFMPGEISQLVGVCEKIAKDIRNRYTLGYVPANRQMNNKVRRIRVLANAPDRGKLTVRTRTEYLAAIDQSRHAHQHH
jgi:VWFA-related protein